jgi:hypothetical protein
MTNLSLSKGTSSAALERDNFGCFCCGETVLNRDYRIHTRRTNLTGETAGTSNLITTCTLCLDDMNTKPDVFRRLGYLIPNTRKFTPTAVPILHHEQGWVVLDDMGGFARAHREEVEEWEACWG